MVPNEYKLKAATFRVACKDSNPRRHLRKLLPLSRDNAFQGLPLSIHPAKPHHWPLDS